MPDGNFANQLAQFWRDERDAGRITQDQWDQFKSWANTTFGIILAD